MQMNFLISLRHFECGSARWHLADEKSFALFHPATTRFVHSLSLSLSPPSLPQFVITWTYLEFLISFHSLFSALLNSMKYEKYSSF